MCPPSPRAFSARIGFFRIMEVLSRHGIRATFALNSEVCEAYPPIVEDAVKLGWEFIGHNQSNTRALNSVPAETEGQVIRDTLAVIAEATGTKPTGWLSTGLFETWDTLDHLVDAGCAYVADWCNDDQPFFMDVGGKRLVSLPYSLDIKNMGAFRRQ